MPHLELALRVAEGLESMELFAQALTSKSLTLLMESRFREAEILLQAALTTAVDADLPSTVARALNNLAVLYESCDRYEDAIASSARGVEYLRRIGDRTQEQVVLAGTISTRVLVGRWDDAYAQLAEIYGSDLTAVGDLWEDLHVVEIACWRGRLDEAKEHIQRHSEAALPHADSQRRTSYILHAALIARMEGDASASLEEIERELPGALDELGISFLTTKLMLVEGLEAAFELGDTAKVEELLAIIERHRPGERPPLLEAHAARFRAKLGVSPDDVEAQFRRAVGIFRERELIMWLAVTQLEYAEWLLGQDRGSDAEPLLAEARATFERLEATPWVRRAAATTTPERTEVTA
jgi:tetratricopeptide (TPR) repeat protein